MKRTPRTTKTKPLKRYRAYKIKWVDARSLTEKTWFYLSDIAKFLKGDDALDNDIFESVGYLAGETKYSYIFAAEYCPRESFTCFSGMFSCPKGCILSMRRIK